MDWPTRTIEVDLLAASTGVTISIRDHGIGIPADRLDDIFVPFYSTKAGGSGVGLPVAWQVAALHSGTLAVKPVTRGSCFQMHLPSSSTI